MKKISFAIIALSLLSVITFGQSFAAQDNASKASSDQANTNMSTAQDTLRMSNLLDARVKEKGGGDVGEIKEVLIDNQGQARYAVLAGPYNKLYPIPMQALQQREKDGPFYLNMTKDQLDHAPSFSKDQWEQLTTLQWEKNVISYYGEQVQPKIQSPSGQRSSTGSEQSDTDR